MPTTKLVNDDSDDNYSHSQRGVTEKLEKSTRGAPKQKPIRRRR